MQVNRQKVSSLIYLSLLFLMSSSAWLHRLTFIHHIGLFPLNFNINALLSICLVSILYIW